MNLFNQNYNSFSQFQNKRIEEWVIANLLENESCGFDSGKG